MSPYMASISANSLWAVALVIGLVGALAAAALLAILVRTVAAIDTSAKGLLEVAGKVAQQTSHIPALRATAPVLGQINDELKVQDSYMNALTDGFGGGA